MRRDLVSVSSRESGPPSVEKWVKNIVLLISINSRDDVQLLYVNGPSERRVWDAVGKCVGLIEFGFRSARFVLFESFDWFSDRSVLI